MFVQQPKNLILASASPSRAALMRGAGLEFEIVPANLDEGAIKEAIATDQGLTPGDVAEVLARAKAEMVSGENSSSTVIGADQVLALGDRLFDKPTSMEEARQTILALQGETHQLHSAVVIVRGGNVTWSHVDRADMTMRSLTPEEVGRYTAQAGESIMSSVGAYQLESIGVHLFEKITGDYFTILGLPMLELLDRLRLDAGEGA